MPWQEDGTGMGHPKWKWIARAKWWLRLAAEQALTSTMALDLVSNSYLEENTAKIRVKQVPWEVRLVVFTVSHLIRIERTSIRDINAQDISPLRSSHLSRK